MLSTARIDGGSRLAVGSSRNNTSGASAEARASASRCRSPPERTRADRSAMSLKPTRESALSARARASRPRTPASASACSTLPAAERRSSTGRWNTIACRGGRVVDPPHAMRPESGAISPCRTRSSVLLPAPFAPRMNVRSDGSMRAPTRSSTRVPRRMMVTSCATIGRPTAISTSPKTRPRPLSRQMCADVDENHERDEHDAEAERERQVALARLERDRRRHHARDAIDVAADDDHRPHFRGGATEAREQHRQQRKARVPQKRQRRLPPRSIQASQLLAVFDPRVLDHLARQRRDDRHDQERLRDHHRGRREEQAELAERTGSRQEQIDDEADDDRRQSHRRVQRNDERIAAGKAHDADGRAERQADHRRAQRRRQADGDREADDLREARIDVRDHVERQRKALRDRVHRGCSLCRPTAILCCYYKNTQCWVGHQTRKRQKIGPNESGVWCLTPDWSARIQASSRSTASGATRTTSRVPSQPATSTASAPPTMPYAKMIGLNVKRMSNTRSASAHPIALAPVAPSSPASAPCSRNSAKCAPRSCARDAPSVRTMAASRFRSSCVDATAACRTNNPPASVKRNTNSTACATRSTIPCSSRRISATSIARMFG